MKLGGQDVDPRADEEVPYSQNSLQVRFAALTFVEESSVMFRYRLANPEGNWLETRAAGAELSEASARALHAGGDGPQRPGSLERPSPRGCTFQIRTPWCLTWWFRIGSVHGGPVVGAPALEAANLPAGSERQRLETAVTQRTRELSLEKQRVVEEKARAEHENAVVQQQNKEIERLLMDARQASQFQERISGQHEP